MRVALCAISVLATSACGRLSFELDGDGGVVGQGDGASAGCGPWTSSTRFTTPRRVTELNVTGEQQQPHLSSDGRTIYYAAFTTAYDIYSAQRATPDVAFTNVGLLAEVSSTNYETSFAPVDDELTAYMSSNRGGNTDLFISQRNATTDPWGMPTQFAASTTFIDYDPFISKDGLRFYWAILDWDQGVGATDLVVATRASTAEAFGPPSLLAGLLTTSEEDNPSETADGRMLVFSSTRGSITGPRIYFATRASTSASYGAPNLVPDVNEGGVANGEPFVTADGCQLWFTSNRGPTGNYDIHVADVIR